MKFKLTLHSTPVRQQIPLSYQYELSSWIYRVIAHADEVFADFLHEKGYIIGRKTFKFFTFSNLIIPHFSIKDDRLTILSPEITFFVSFYVDEIAENFITGLFQDQQFRLGDFKSQANFQVKEIVSVSLPLLDETVVFRTLSPIVIGEKNEKGHDQYLAPTHEKFGHYLIENLFEKYQATGQKIPEEWQEFPTKFEMLGGQQPKSRLITLKSNKAQETKVKGFYNFKFRLIVPKALIELGLLAGVGRMNGQGFGCVEEAKE